MSSLDNVVFVCLDCETTGLDVQRDCILEFAAAKFSKKQGIIEKISFLVKPKGSIPAENTKIHGITDKDTENEKPFSHYVDIIQKFISSHPIVGHTIPFDLSMLENNALRCNKHFNFKDSVIIDTMRLVRQYQNSTSNSLIGLCNHFNIPLQPAHRALSDVKMNIDIFCILMNTFKDLEHLKQTVSKPIRILYMPFGTHRGEKISNIPAHYIMYILKKMHLDNDLKYTLQLETKMRKSGRNSYSSPFFDTLQ